jgi:hypothetical protein
MTIPAAILREYSGIQIIAQGANSAATDAKTTVSATNIANKTVLVLNPRLLSYYGRS